MISNQQAYIVWIVFFASWDKRQSTFFFYIHDYTSMHTLVSKNQSLSFRGRGWRWEAVGLWRWGWGVGGAGIVTLSGILSRTEVERRKCDWISFAKTYFDEHWRRLWPCETKSEMHKINVVIFGASEVSRSRESILHRSTEEKCASCTLQIY